MIETIGFPAWTFSGAAVHRGFGFPLFRHPRESGDPAPGRHPSRAGAMGAHAGAGSPLARGWRI